MPEKVVRKMKMRFVGVKNPLIFKLTRAIIGIFVVQITLILVYFNTLTITMTNKSILLNWNNSFKT